MKKILTLMLSVGLAVLTMMARDVEPLLGDMWRHQEAPFNKYCPLYGTTGQRCLVGCVATACESILTYHGGTITLQKPLPGWETDNYTIAEIPAGETVVCADDDEEAVARLGYWCGVACRMNYSPGASGANVNRLVKPLREAFGMGYVEYLDSYRYSPETWHAVIREELEHGRPVLYAGYTCGLSGHAFVVDGVREDGLYHVNWGYGGYYDGHWYSLEELCAQNPPYDRRLEDSRMQGFFCNQEMLLLHPEAQVNPYVADSLNRTGEEIRVEVALPEGGLIAGQLCPVTFTMTNTTNLALTTPLEVFTNEPERTDSIFHYGDYGALLGASLRPGESRSLTIPVRFSEAGLRVLRVSPDDEHLVWESAPLTVAPPQRVSLSFGQPRLTLEGTTARLSIDVTNTGTVTAGTYLLSCLFEGATLPEVKDGDTRHYNYIYTRAGDTETLQMEFRGLTPGADYTLLLRQTWTPLDAQGLAFRVPDVPEAIERPCELRRVDAASIVRLGPIDLSISNRRKQILRH